MSDSLQTPGLQHTRLLCPWNSPSKITGVGCCFLLQGIFLTQGIKPRSSALQADTLPSEPLVFILLICSSSFREGNGTPLQYSCLENPMDGGAWWAAVHGVAKSGTRLSDFTFTFHFHVLEKEMSTHSSVLAWRIPGTGEPGWLPSMGSHRVGHD